MIEIVWLLMWLNVRVATLNAMLQLLVILVFNPRNARDPFMNILKSITEDIFK